MQPCVPFGDHLLQGQILHPVPRPPSLPFTHVWPVVPVPASLGMKSQTRLPGDGNVEKGLPEERFFYFLYFLALTLLNGFYPPLRSDRCVALYQIRLRHPMFINTSLQPRCICFVKGAVLHSVVNLHSIASFTYLNITTGTYTQQ